MPLFVQETESFVLNNVQILNACTIVLMSFKIKQKYKENPSEVLAKGIFSLGKYSVHLIPLVTGSTTL